MLKFSRENLRFPPLNKHISLYNQCINLSFKIDVDSCLLLNNANIIIILRNKKFKFGCCRYRALIKIMHIF